ncbi:hypothetical protein NIES2135_15580 [Leptolyngbya boryana NIES-2135]|uniref:Uncharacterized protein n=1 Tax=Leptolyngbya boryana NIES-2135 TaxID=1973484 RepID=A0A1Z4JDF5_LEPBY|nr:hypothetical protein NIES2135_15580 [Leptolyngbya boryana NIES-2135]
MGRGTLNVNPYGGCKIIHRLKVKSTDFSSIANSTARSHGIP